jgi:acyl carrier protein
MAYLDDDFVRVALAQYLDLKPFNIDMKAELGRDLGLEPLDLVLIVFRLEEFADAEFSVSDLEGVMTVADFDRVVRAWARDASVEEEDDRPAPPVAGESGTHVLGTTIVSGPQAAPSNRKVRAAR